MDLFIETLILIPARGGSKGIPRKNLRDLNGKPLLFYSIETASKLKNSKIILDTDDDEIEYVTKSEFSNIDIHRRKLELGNDNKTIDDVIFSFLKSNKYDFQELLVLQPTSPLLSYKTIDKALLDFRSNNYNSAIAVTEFKHLLWKLDEQNNPKLVQNERVNRQEMESLYIETGGFTITKKSILDRGIRIEVNPAIINIPSNESLDLDTPVDWLLAEKKLKLNDLYIYVEGNNQIGLGHIYNVLEVAQYLASYNLIFITPSGDELAKNVLKSFNYPVLIIEKNDLPKFFSNKNGRKRLILDSLDSSDELINNLVDENVRIISFEDRNTKKYKNRIVINALYDGMSDESNFFGDKYFVMRREFLSKRKMKFKGFNKALISFGGADPQNYTEKVYKILRESFSGHVTIIMGKANKRNIITDSNTTLMRDVTNMAHHMLSADVAFTSAGRTSLECASIGLPAVVLNQNMRELEHKFANFSTGFLRSRTIGINDEQLRSIIIEFSSEGFMAELFDRMKKIDFLGNTKKTIELIKKHIE